MCLGGDDSHLFMGPNGFGKERWPRQRGPCLYTRIYQGLTAPKLRSVPGASQKSCLGETFRDILTRECRSHRAKVKRYLPSYSVTTVEKPEPLASCWSSYPRKPSPTRIHTTGFHPGLSLACSAAPCLWKFPASVSLLSRCLAALHAALLAVPF